MPASRTLLAALLLSLALPALAEETEGEREGPALRSSEPASPIRERRRFAVAGEVGWNSLSGLGVNVTYNALPRLALDLGEGVSILGYKTGARARYHLTEGHWAPFVGAGLLFGTGNGKDNKVKIKIDGKESRIRVLPSGFVQAVAGVDFVGERGFTLTAAAGWAQLLREKNFVVLSGEPVSKANQRSLAGSGLVLSLAAGYAF